MAHNIYSVFLDKIILNLPWEVLLIQKRNLTIIKKNTRTVDRLMLVITLTPNKMKLFASIIIKERICEAGLKSAEPYNHHDSQTHESLTDFLAFTP